MSKRIAEVRRRMDAGDLLLAFDLATASLERFPDDVTLKHLAALSLARTGATDRALQLFRVWDLDRSSDGHVRALEARLAKDRALALAGAERQQGLLDAADLYLRAAAGSPDPYQRINAASLLYLAGRQQAAADLASAVLAAAGGDDYWSAATRVEAKILLREHAAAAAELEHAAKAAGASPSACATTRRQLRRLLAAGGLPDAAIETFLAPLAPPPTVSLGTSHLWDDAPGKRALASIRRAIDAALADIAPGAVFTTLGSAAELIFAERARSAGAELTIVLPAAEAIAAKAVDAAAGGQWGKRFRTCCRKADRLVCVSDDPEAGAWFSGGYAARTAQGLAALRAQHIDGEAIEVVIAPDDEAEAGADAPIDRLGGRRRVVVRVPTQGRRAAPAGGAEPHCRAIVFADLPGFSRLPERLLPVFWDVVMAAVGEVVRSAGDKVALANTWGDGVHLVVADAASAAGICLAMQRRLAAIDGRVLEREAPPTMRIGAHYGPAREGFDPVTLRTTFFGRALSRAARIEPVTPPGAVYVTEAFAAILLLEAGGAFTCTYVGQVPLAKGYGTFRMYVLAAAGQ